MLYRYLGLKEERNFHWLSDLLTEGRLFFPSGSVFNDPNEFRFQLRTPTNKKVIKATWQRDNAGKDETEFEQWYSTTNFKGWHIYLEPIFHETFLKAYGMTCFSHRNDNPPMWSHYANNHAGICLGFDDRPLHSVTGADLCGDVSYRRALPVVRYFGEAETTILRSIFFTKSLNWKYEQEFRIIAGANITLTISPSSIRELIFGKDLSRPVEERVREILSKRRAPILVRNASLSYATYELEIR